MPFVSQAQRKWMYANKPKMAKEWEEHTSEGKKLPEHVKESEYITSDLFECFEKISHLIIKQSTA